MAGRIRSIKPEVLDDEQAAALSDEAWRLWLSTWLLADDHGNCRAGDKYLAALVWQDTSRSKRIPAVLRELQKSRRLVVYDNNGERYAHINNWKKHQRIDNAGKPRVPGHDHENSRTWDDSRGNLREPPRTSETLGKSPLDQRPPTNDHRPLLDAPSERQSSAIPDQAEFALQSPQKQKKTGPTKQQIAEAFTFWNAQWIKARQPADGKPPTMTKPDKMQVVAMLKKYGLEDFCLYVLRYLDDNDRLVVGSGHAARLMPSRIDGYRSNVLPIRGKIEKPVYYAHSSEEIL